MSVGGQRTTDHRLDDPDWTPTREELRALIRTVAELQGRVSTLEDDLKSCHVREVVYTDRASSGKQL